MVNKFMCPAPSHPRIQSVPPPPPLRINMYHICDVTCQNQAFVAEMGCLVMILLRENVN